MACCDGLRLSKADVALDGHAVGLFDGAQAGGDPGFAGGDGLAVAAAVGAFGQVLAGPFDLADVGVAFPDGRRWRIRRCWWWRPG